MSDDHQLLNAKQMGAMLGVSGVTITQWHKDGKIPAEIAEGRLFKFDLERSKEALRKRAERP